MTIQKQIQMIIDEICNDYCKYHEVVGTEEDWEKLIEEHCSECPLVVKL